MNWYLLRWGHRRREEALDGDAVSSKQAPLSWRKQSTRALDGNFPNQRGDWSKSLDAPRIPHRGEFSGQHASLLRDERLA